MRYWHECVSEALESAGVKVTPEQLEEIVACVESGHENYSMAYPVPESPYPREISELKRALKREQDKVYCRQCEGRGSITEYGPGTLCATSQCFKCRGEGRYLP